MRVELLFWDADPEYMTARQRLVEVLIEDAFETPIQMIAVASEQDAEFLALPGSPTIRIDGADIDPVGRRGNRAVPADVPGRRRRIGPSARRPRRSSGTPWNVLAGGGTAVPIPRRPRRRPTRSRSRLRPHVRRQAAQHLQPATLRQLAPVRAGGRAAAPLWARRAGHHGPASAGTGRPRSSASPSGKRSSSRSSGPGTSWAWSSRSTSGRRSWSACSRCGSPATRSIMALRPVPTGLRCH